MKTTDELNDEMIEKISILSKLTLTKEECDKAKQDMAKILTYMNCLGDVDTSDVEPLTHVQASVNVLREDDSGSMVNDACAALSDAVSGEKPAAATEKTHNEHRFVVPNTF